jgi:hypothetical protein
VLVAAEFLVHGLERGDLFDARAAPGGPEVEQDELALELFERERLAVERRRLDGRRDRAGIGRVILERRLRLGYFIGSGLYAPT